MADILCGYTADRDETLVAYLYDDIDPAQRAAFDAHIATCDRCRQDLSELRGVRGRLESWTAPEAEGPLTISAPFFAEAPLAAELPRRPDRWRVLREVPAWAQVAAAILVCGVSAGLAGAIAQLDVHYNHDGLTVRTGWSRPDTGSRAALTGPAAAPGATVSETVGGKAGAPPGAAGGKTNAGNGNAGNGNAGTIVTVGTTTPWTGDLAALEQRLRELVRAASADRAGTLAAKSVAAAATDAQVLRQVQALLEDSERKQRNELALKIAEVVEEFDAKRGNDLANLRNVRSIQTATGAEIARQQQQINYYLLTRTSLQK